MSAIDRPTAENLTSEIEAAVDAIFARHGLVRGRPSSTTYGAEYIVKVTAVPLQLDETGINRADPEAQLWVLLAKHFQLPLDGLGRTFVSQGQRFQITGLNDRRPKYPVSAKCLDNGKMYTFTAESVRNALGQ